MTALRNRKLKALQYVASADNATSFGGFKLSEGRRDLVRLT